MIRELLRKIFNRLSIAWDERAIALKALSFAFVGLINTAIDFSIFWTAATWLGWPLVTAANWSHIGWPLVLANVFAWSVAVSCSYVLNSFTTFGPESGRILRWRDYFTFATSGVAGMVMGTATLFALSFATTLLIAKLAAIIVSFAVNFSLSHWVVFRARKPHKNAKASDQ